MKTLVVLFAVAAVGCCSWVPLAQPPHHAAVVLDPHGRPLDTAEVIGARALHLQAKALEGHDAHLIDAVAAPAIIAAPTAVSHQSRVDIHNSPAIVSHALTSPVVAHATPFLTHGWADHGHLLTKRSVAHVAYSVPIVAPSAVSHQSRVDVISSPAVISHAVAPSVIAHAVPAAAVSHQSRVDVRNSPTAITHASVAPLTHSIIAAPWAASAWTGHDNLAHHLYKRSAVQILTPIVHTIPSAVSHQSRVDVISKPAVVSHTISAPIVAHVTPVAVAHVAPAAVSHQARVEVISSAAHIAPVTHAGVWAAPLAHSHTGLLKASYW